MQVAFHHNSNRQSKKDDDNKNISLHQIKEKFYEEIDEHDDGNRSDGPEGIEFTGESEEDLSSE